MRNPCLLLLIINCFYFCYVQSQPLTEESFKGSQQINLNITSTEYDESNYDDLYSDEDISGTKTKPMNFLIETSGNNNNPNNMKSENTSYDFDIITIICIIAIFVSSLVIIAIIIIIISICRKRSVIAEDANKENTYLHYMDSFASFDRYTFFKRDSEPPSPTIESSPGIIFAKPGFKSFFSTNDEKGNEKLKPPSSLQNTLNRNKVKKTLSFKEDKNVKIKKSGSKGDEKTIEITFNDLKTIKIKINTNVTIENVEV